MGQVRWFAISLLIVTSLAYVYKHHRYGHVQRAEDLGPLSPLHERLPPRFNKLANPRN